MAKITHKLLVRVRNKLDSEKYTGNTTQYLPDTVIRKLYLTDRNLNTLFEYAVGTMR